MNEYEKYEDDCKRIRIANDNLLVEFEAWLKSAGLSKNTINKHCSNINFYINEYLLYEDAIEAKDGAQCVNMFLGYWFIRKTLWASQTAIKSNASSFKKFYTFLLEKCLIKKEDLNQLEQTIKNEMPEWLETLDEYDNQSNFEDF